MKCCGNRCPYCGRLLNGRTTGSAQTTRTTACTSENTRDLYGRRRTAETTYTACCDAYSCTEYSNRRRCSYWPGFCHPRWLTCSQLYARGRR
ncbi:hypothetical protein LJC63_04345 [Ruminococcaceae bacterium OttesenSCG-928-L11]|nr:hypothetical protein [Ruminococcaceae bacterium OttesenSCG-928-L11]